VWKSRKAEFGGDVIHTMGYPLKSNTYGGGFIYGMKDNKLSIGLLTGLEYADPFMDPHREFQRLKQHPYIAGLLKDGKMIQYGAKTAPVGGYFSVPKLTFPGGLLIGDCASLFIGMKLKGIHAAMKSGMLAAETIFAAMVKEDFSEKAFETYPLPCVRARSAGSFTCPAISPGFFRRGCGSPS